MEMACARRLQQKRAGSRDGQTGSLGASGSEGSGRRVSWVLGSNSVTRPLFCSLWLCITSFQSFCKSSPLLIWWPLYKYTYLNIYIYLNKYIFKKLKGLQGQNKQSSLSSKSSYSSVCIQIHPFHEVFPKVCWPQIFWAPCNPSLQLST